jgi:hypothetical protein
MKALPWAIGALLLSSATAQALDYQFDELNITINNRFSSGIAIRMQQPSNDLIGKTNVPGQQDLCTRDSCLSITGDPEPNRRLINAAGAFSAVNSDNGDINYQRYDIVSAINRLSSDMTVKYGDYLGRVRGIVFYDPINTNFQEHHNDTRFQSETSPRSGRAERLVGTGFDLYDAYVQKEFRWGDHNGAVSIGYQTVRWGESTLIARNAIAEINSPSAVVLHTPGFEINEVFRPVPAIVISSDLADGVSAEFFYQLKWQPVQPDPAGSFFGDFDLLEGNMAIISLGQLGEDPDKKQRFNGPVSLVSSSSGTVYLSDPHEPRDMGQFGVRLNYNADWLLGGTEMGFYFLNYHSRYPYAAVVATDASCSREVGPDGRTNDTDKPDTNRTLVACQLFNGSLLGRENEHNREREPLPIDTLGLYLDYPENIQMYGISFNTTVGGISFAGEYSFRPNLPLQVATTDVVQAGLQPAFPANDFLIDPTALLNTLNPLIGPLTPEQASNLQQLASSRFPGANTAVPSYLKKYRGYGAIQPHQVIPGYERFAVGQLDLTMIKVFSTNPFGADQILSISEAGFTQVYGMPDLSELQLETGYPNRTHASIGQDEKGPNDFATLNPHRQTEGFADAFSWGIRQIIKAEYNDVVFGWGFKPTLIAQWDIGGIAPFPIQNFVEGRQQYDFGTDINITQSFSSRVNYQIYTGGGGENTLKDRDNLSLSFAYSF